MTRHKKLPKNGSLTLPKNLRAAAGILPGTAIDLNITADGGILITKHIASCSYCGSAQDVKQIKGRETCKKCAVEIIEEVKKAYEHI